MVKRILSLCAALIVAIGLFFSPVRSTTTTVHASSVENNMDTTSVEDDLGEDFNWLLYPKNPLGDFQLLQFVEYCYTDNVAQKGNYALYLYVYNPAELRFSMNNNVVNMAVAYKDGAPSSYENVPLVLCGYTHGDYAFRVYKFRVDAPASVYVNARTSNLANGYRQYDIAGIQLRPMGELLSKDNEVARTFKCSGYVKGYDETSETESTYACVASGLDVLALECHSTFYRPGGSNGKNSYTQDTLHSVYFSVPNEVVNEYDRLYRIRCSYIKALTDWMYLTGRKDIYDAIYEYIGENNLGWDVLVGNYLKYGFAAHDSSNRWIYGYNTRQSGDADYVISQLDYIFYAGSGVDSADEYIVDGDEILAWMQAYSEEFSDDDYITVDGTSYAPYSKELFLDSKLFTTEIDVRADEMKSLTSETIKSSWWDKLWGTGGSDLVTSQVFNGIESIHKVTADEMSLEKALLCDTLYISTSDYNEFVNFYNAASQKEETVYLFRFDISDYAALETVQGETKTTQELVSGFDNSDTNGRLFQQYVYLNFDIIFLEYEKNNTYTIFPVVSDPIDIVADGTPALHTNSDKDFDWWKILLGLLVIVGIIILIVSFGPALLKTILAWIWKIVSWPFKKLGQALKRLFSRRR